MRAAVCHVLFLIPLALVAILSSPLSAADRAVDTLELTAADTAILGTWTGTILLEGTADPMDGGLITIASKDDRLAVTIGPSSRVRYSCERLARTERGLRFEARLPGEDTRLLAYDVTIDEGVMTGTVTFVRYGLTKPGRMQFVRQ
jgi:hypothetical protein